MFGFNFEPTTFLGFMLGFVIGTTFHEFMHAYSALLLGDTTAQRQGRVTLNPVAHFDPVGFFMGVLLALGLPALAWGRPVPVNPYALRFGRRGMAIVAVAGPLSNLAFAAVLVPLMIISRNIFPPDVSRVIGNMISINLLLFAFNLVPIPPLDGFNILVGILPNYWTLILEPIRRYSLPILFAFIFIIPYAGRIIGIPLDLLSEALGPVITTLNNVFFGFVT
jgi:Zn-dependent protease